MGITMNSEHAKTTDPKMTTAVNVSVLFRALAAAGIVTSKAAITPVVTKKSSILMELSKPAGCGLRVQRYPEIVRTMRKGKLPQNTRGGAPATIHMTSSASRRRSEALSHNTATSGTIRNHKLVSKKLATKRDPSPQPKPPQRRLDQLSAPP